MLSWPKLFVFVSVAATTGCSRSAPETFQVRGTVTCDGAAVPTGMVTFVPNGAGERVTGSIGPDGRYEVMAFPGSYKVAVVAVEETPPQDISKENWKDAFTQFMPKHYVPQAFGDAETSRLTCTIQPVPENDYDISISTRSVKRR